MIELRNVTKTYGTRCVLNIPSLTLERGKIYAAVGANGSGKSTLARIIAGALTPDKGSEVLRGADLRVGYMPQASYPFQLSVLSNVLLTSRDRKADTPRAMALLEELGIAELAKKKASRLSGGETARMALARLLMKENDILVLDEPAAALDIHATQKAEEIIRRYRDEKNCTVFLVTHSLKQAERLADELLFMYEGELAEYGRCADVLAAPKDARTKQFFDFYA